MPALMTLGGIALAVLGLLIAFAGMPDRAAGLGLGSDLIQAGASIFAGGLIVAALGQVLKSLRDVADRVEEAGMGVTAPRPSLHDEFGEDAPKPLPRAAGRSAPVSPLEEPAEVRPAREPRAQQPAPRTPPAPPAPRTPQAQPQARAARTPEPSQPLVRPQPRTAPQTEANFETPQQDDDLNDDFTTGRDGPRPEPRWMRAQAETANRQQAAGTVPLKSSRANPVAPVAPPRREAAPLPTPDAYEPELRRRPAPQPEEAEHGEPTVVRSGIIAGMAYTLYSDRSIEAELPSGLVRFNSLSELQEHVRRAGVEEPEEYRAPSGSPH
jgi:hypothetical protein